jgi:hypothetical protein
MFHRVEQTTAERTAAAVRAELARRKINGSDLARTLRWPRSKTWRRISGTVPFKLDELMAVADVLDVPLSTFLPDREAA